MTYTSFIFTGATFVAAVASTLNRDPGTAWLTAFFAGLTVLSLLIRREK